MLIKFQNISYNTYNIFVEGIYDFFTIFKYVRESVYILLFSKTCTNTQIEFFYHKYLATWTDHCQKFITNNISHVSPVQTYQRNFQSFSILIVNSVINPREMLQKRIKERAILGSYECSIITEIQSAIVSRETFETDYILAPIRFMRIAKNFPCSRRYHLKLFPS